MKMIQRLCLAIAALISSMTVRAGALPKVGEKAPDFSVAASDGTTVHLKDYIGKGNIVLYFYPKDDTTGCTKEACGIRDAFSEFQNLKATVWGVSFDPVVSHKKFIEKYKLPFVLLADTEKKVAIAYGVADERSPVASRVTFIIDKQGKIAFVNRAVNPATHAGELRTFLSGMSE
jgi:thioredoxin-dependent peroxiredoxin